MRNKLSVFIFYLLLIGCNNERPTTLLQLITASESKIDFVNNLRESPSQNVLNYEYFYNGAGVAVADFNNDKFPDIYLVSNLEKNVLYLNQKDLSFKNVNNISKTGGKRGFATGVSIVDINADGRLDIYICKSGRFTDPELRRNELLVNLGNDEMGIPIFEEQAKQYGLDISAYSTQASFFDYDKDGDLDMFLINHGIDTYDVRDLTQLKQESSPFMGEMLFKNENDFFIDATKEAGIVNNKLGFSLGLGIADLNNDNYPDVYVSNDYSGKDHLYINQRDGTFEEKIRELTNQISFYAMGNDIGDINNDGWQDIINLDMVAAENYGIKTSMSAMNPEQFHDLVEQGEHYQYMFNSLLLNTGIVENGASPYFSNIGQLAGISNTDWSWAPLLFDMDNDGWQDLFVTNGIKRNIRNNDAVKVVNQLRQQFLASKSEQEKIQLTQQMLNQFPYHQKSNYFFRNDGKLAFSDITNDLGLDSLFSVSSGAAYADLDLDGDLDLVVNNADQPAFILKNNTNAISSNKHLIVKLQGTDKNPFGIGATVRLEGSKGIQTKELYTSRGYKSSIEPVLHFGLGTDTNVPKLTVTWGDGKIQELVNVKAGNIILNHKDASFPKENNRTFAKTIFSKPSTSFPFFHHQENEYNDFLKESLLPHKMSHIGPSSSIGDVNKDGIEDFFIGGAKGQAAQFFLGRKDGSFEILDQDLWNLEKNFEDVASCLFDADSDGDLDLIVGSGSNELDKNDDAYLLRFYENINGTSFKKNRNVLPELRLSAGVIIAADIDNDKDEDLFIGGRQNPGNYPHPCSSFILKNESQNSTIKFLDATESMAPFLENYGMVTDAKWEDLNGDDKVDLITVGEWMSPKVLINNGLSLEDQTISAQLSDEKGWWYSVAIADFDGDGDQDLIAGNLGLNYKYKGSKEKPFEIFTNDFDSNGSQDIVLSYYEDDALVPLRGRECSSHQMPFIKEKFKTYDAFGKATMKEVFGEKKLAASIHLQANNFEHCYFENIGNTVFKKRPLPIETQISSINSFLIQDFNHDGNLDFLCAGNLYEAEVETPRNDASFGHLVLGNGKGDFEVVPFSKSGFRTKGEIRNLYLIKNKLKQLSKILVVKNNDPIEWFEINKNNTLN